MAKRRKKAKPSKRGGKRWSARVTRESNALEKAKSELRALYGKAEIAD